MRASDASRTMHARPAMTSLPPRDPGRGPGSEALPVCRASGFVRMFYVLDVPRVRPSQYRSSRQC